MSLPAQRTRRRLPIRQSQQVALRVALPAHQPWIDPRFANGAVSRPRAAQRRHGMQPLSPDFDLVPGNRSLLASVCASSWCSSRALTERPRRLAWPRTPDFQTCSGVVRQSPSISLSHTPSQEFAHLARRPNHSRHDTERDRVSPALAEECHQSDPERPFSVSAQVRAGTTSVVEHDAMARTGRRR